jgi:hypothetical protein
MRVQRTGSEQGLLFAKCGHERTIITGQCICQVISAHTCAYGANAWISSHKSARYSHMPKPCYQYRA